MIMITVLTLGKDILRWRLLIQYAIFVLLLLLIREFIHYQIQFNLRKDLAFFNIVDVDIFLCHLFKISHISNSFIIQFYDYYFYQYSCQKFFLLRYFYQLFSHMTVTDFAHIKSQSQINISTTSCHPSSLHSNSLHKKTKSIT